MTALLTFSTASLTPFKSSSTTSFISCTAVSMSPLTTSASFSMVSFTSFVKSPTATATSPTALAILSNCVWCSSSSSTSLAMLMISLKSDPSLTNTLVSSNNPMVPLLTLTFSSTNVVSNPPEFIHSDKLGIFNPRTSAPSGSNFNCWFVPATLRITEVRLILVRKGTKVSTLAVWTRMALDLSIWKGLSAAGRKLFSVLSNSMMLSMRSMVGFSSSSGLDVRMRCVTVMLSWSLAAASNLGSWNLLVLGPLSFCVSPRRSSNVFPRGVRRDVARSVQLPRHCASDSSEVVGEMASNLATAFMNAALSAGRERKTPVGLCLVSF
mmetsp:Transcript_2238/g.3381  ORF Transcript_2238/g.3381 Transcript_2238/m.3381 type:complete len:324 (-) Transcript_2238:481-1452(-)